LSNFCSKAKARWPLSGQVVPVRAVALPVILAPSARRGKRGARVSWVPHSAGVRGRGWKHVKAVADRLLIDVEAGASDELPLLVTQSFRVGRYLPLTGMEGCDRTT
jgi:hypothetical protein